MSWLWLIPAFAAGWLSCWWFGKFVLGMAFKGGGPIMQDAIQNLKQESLLKVRSIADAEIEKRKAGLP